MNPTKKIFIDIDETLVFGGHSIQWNSEGAFPYSNPEFTTWTGKNGAVHGAVISVHGSVSHIQVPVVVRPGAQKFIQNLQGLFGFDNVMLLSYNRPSYVTEMAKLFGVAAGHCATEQPPIHWVSTPTHTCLVDDLGPSDLGTKFEWIRIFYNLPKDHVTKHIRVRPFTAPEYGPYLVEEVLLEIQKKILFDLHSG